MVPSPSGIGGPPPPIGSANQQSLNLPQINAGAIFTDCWDVLTCANGPVPSFLTTLCNRISNCLSYLASWCFFWRAPEERQESDVVRASSSVAESAPVVNRFRGLDALLSSGLISESSDLEDQLDTIPSLEREALFQTFFARLNAQSVMHTALPELTSREFIHSYLRDPNNYEVFKDAVNALGDEQSQA